MKYFSPIASGNGACIVHQTLQKQISGYKVSPYNPKWTFTPFLLPLLFNHKADLIHTTPDYGCWFSKSQIPMVVTFHNYVLDPFMDPYSSTLKRIHYRSDLRFFIKKSVQNAALVTSVSQFTADLAKKHLPCTVPIKVIPNGVDADRFYPLKKTINQPMCKVLFSGNLTRRKGVQWLPGIASLLNKNSEIVYTQGLKKNNNLLVASNIRSIGAIPYHEMPQLYNDVDILLMPTVREGMSLAVLEAMACGLPVVTSNCSSMPELIEHGKGGYLCEIGNCSEFAVRINELAENQPLRHEMGAYNRAKIEQQYSQPKMIRAYQDVFESVLS